jgi:hypothetical protein
VQAVKQAGAAYKVSVCRVLLAGQPAGLYHGTGVRQMDCQVLASDPQGGSAGGMSKTVRLMVVEMLELKRR